MHLSHMRPLELADDGALASLAVTAEREGFRFLDRLQTELLVGIQERDGERSFFLAITVASRLAGVGGVTPDPYVSNDLTGRIRHVYVAPEYRRKGLGRLLIHTLEQRATEQYRELRLRTDTQSAALFYETLGYTPIDDLTATHRKTCKTEDRSAGNEITSELP